MKAGRIGVKEVIENKSRLDGSYHLSDAQIVKAKIHASPYPLTTIGKIAKRIWHAGRWKRVYVDNPKTGITLLGSSSMLKGDLSNEKMVSKKYTQDIPDKLLEKGWILISCSGTIGNCAFTNAQHAGKLASQDVIRIYPNNILGGGLIYAYLSSKYGYVLLTQGTAGSVIQHIEPEHVEVIPIPLFPEEFQYKVDSMIQESARLREEAADALSEAVDYFNTKFPIEDTYTKTFQRTIGEVKDNFASFNNNLEVRDFIQSYYDDSFKVGEKVDRLFAPPLFKHIYLGKNNGYPFITGSELTQFNVRYYRWLSPRGVKEIHDYIVEEGTLLLYKSGTTDGGILGQVFIVDKSLDGCCLSDHVIRIKFKDKKLSFWTFAFLRSTGAIKMLQSFATGTMIPFITPDRISKTLIPSPNQDFERITGLISEYVEKNSKSKQLELEAIAMVEAEIEKWN